LALAARTAEVPKPAPQPTALPLPDKPSIAVLPFQNMSGDPEQEYFADGVVSDIIYRPVALQDAVRDRTKLLVRL
jgi:TolB-like protein